MASSAIKPPPPTQLPVNTETGKQSKLASLTGIWAWKQGAGAKDEASPNDMTEEPEPGQKK
jgi:hypothetical protein